MAIAVDGIWGDTTKRYFQSYLSHQGYYHGRIDGRFKEMSITALQYWLKGGSLNTYPGRIDGIAGWMTWNGLFDKLRWYGYGYGDSHVGVMNYKLCQMLQRFINDQSYLFS